MNPLKLIFDYLDGEITRNDDKELRELLNEDTELSRDFRSILDINYELRKSNDELDYPENFFDDVEELVIGRMTADNAAKKEKVRKRRVLFGYTFAAVPAMILLLVISTMNFGNLPLNLNKLNLITNEDLISEISTDDNELIPNVLIQENEKTQKQYNNKTNNAGKFNQEAKAVSSGGLIQAKEQIETDDFNSDAKAIALQDKTLPATEILESELTQTVEVNLQDNLPKENESIHKDLSNEIPVHSSFRSGSGTLINNVRTSILPEFGAITYAFNNSEIELNTIFGKDVANIGIGGSKNAVNSFSQSIGAKIDQFTRIGIETGYMELSGNESKYILLKGTSSGLGTTVLDNSDENEVLIRKPGMQTADKKMYWAGVFYERNLIDLSKFSLSSRMSVGASDVGFVSSLKVIGRYNLYGRLDLSVGADAKLFNGAREYFISDNAFGTTISVIYGIRYSF